VCHTCGLAISIKKKYFKAKERIMETQIFHPAKIDLMFKKILQKKPKSFKIL
jgi:hypothetical protein